MIRALLAALLVTAAAPAAAETIAIINGTVATGDGSGPIEGGTVLIRNGRIVAAGQGVRVPVDSRVIDASGKWVTPGIVAGFSRLGLADVDLGAGGADDTSARNGPFSAAIDVVPAINPNYQPIAVNRADGVTRALVAPSSAKNIFAGQGAVIDTGADMDPITKARAFGTAGAPKHASLPAIRRRFRRSARRSRTRASSRRSATRTNRASTARTLGGARMYF
jgi:imidazolonepropionase-like amidohydrolase